MVVARFRRTQRRRRDGQRAIDDGKRWLQRDSSENRFSSNGAFLSTRNRLPESSGQPKRIGSCANGGASSAGAYRQRSRNETRASAGTTPERANDIRRCAYTRPRKRCARRVGREHRITAHGAVESGGS